MYGITVMLISGNQTKKPVRKSFFKSCVYSPIKFVRFFLGKIEQQYIRKVNPEPRWPPIFIVGPPRSGTTLAYQVFVVGFFLSYFSNLSDNFFHCPGISAITLCKLGIKDPPICFSSYYGTTRGWHAPSQGNIIWRRWFGSDYGFIGSGQLSVSQIRELRGTVALVERAYGSPFINKSQGNCVRLLPLAETFPNLVIVKINRDPLAMTQSILNGKMELFGDANKWFSVKPKMYETIRHYEHFQQVRAQVRCLEDDINETIKATGRERVFEISYEGLCNSPRYILKEFSEFYSDLTGVNLRKRFSIPGAFNSSKCKKLNL
jgi:hypothetical protein